MAPRTGRARKKQLITVFDEAMSRVASRTSKACFAMFCDTKADGRKAEPVTVCEANVIW